MTVDDSKPMFLSVWVTYVVVSSDDILVMWSSSVFVEEGDAIFTHENNSHIKLDYIEISNLKQ